MVVTPDGQVHIVWESSRPNPLTPQSYYKRFTPGLGWSEDTCISADLVRAQMVGIPAIACDSQGNIHVVWNQWMGYDIWYKMCRTGRWDNISTRICVGSSTLPRGGISPQPRTVISTRYGLNDIHFMASGWCIKKRLGWSPIQRLIILDSLRETNFQHMAVSPVTAEPPISVDGYLGRSFRSFHSYYSGGTWQELILITNLKLPLPGTEIAMAASSITFFNDGSACAFGKAFLGMEGLRRQWINQRSVSDEWQDPALIPSAGRYWNTFLTSRSFSNAHHLYII